jgi:hypothetical protein
VFILKLFLEKQKQKRIFFVCFFTFDVAIYNVCVRKSKKCVIYEPCFATATELSGRNELNTIGRWVGNLTNYLFFFNKKR